MVEEQKETSPIKNRRGSGMITANFHFYAELNDFLPAERKDAAFPYAFEDHQSIKHLIEALGIPHTEVQSIQVNGSPVGFSYTPQAGDSIEVFPFSNASDGEDVPHDLRFILDNHLGRLAAYLRMMGFDTLYRNDYQDEELAQVAHQENRILLTRDRRLLMRSMVQRGYWVRSQNPKQQLVEISKRYQLNGRIEPFQRCLRCNHPLEAVRKEQILSRLEPLTKQYYDEFHICPACGQIYWKGSHYERMQILIQRIENRE